MSVASLPVKAGSLTWKVTNGAGSITVEVSGNLDESVRLDGLKGQLKGRVTLHLAKVERINSCGVREWVNMVRDLKGVDLTMVACSPAVVAQLNMVSNFSGNARIESVYAPYTCEACGNSDDSLITIAAASRKRLPAQPCSCGGSMEFDDLYDRYFAFLLDSEA